MKATLYVVFLTRKDTFCARRQTLMSQKQKGFFPQRLTVGIVAVSKVLTGQSSYNLSMT